MDSMTTGGFLERKSIFILALKKMASDFQILGYTEMAF